MVRLAWTLKKSIREVLEFPRWELDLWRYAFDIFGALDWRRDDFRHASTLQMLSAGGKPLADFLLFKDPTDLLREQETDDTESIMARFGVYGDSDE